MDHPADAARRRLLAAAPFALAAGAWPVAPALAASIARKRTRLILLGTAGGPTPKALRAAPANAVVIDDAVYVIDCGNGVARQLALAGLSLGAIRDVFITHHHSDHNADYGNLLWLAWAADLRRPVDAWGPPPLKRMTRQFLQLNDSDIRTRIADEGRPPLAPLIRAHELKRGGVVMQDERVKVTAALVEHPPVAPAFAYRFDGPDRSIVFSGDTRPSAALVELARGADVLVHEVMYLPALEKLIASEPNAQRLRQHLLDSHTTTEQVGRLASEAGVKTLVLSHFVPGGDASLTDQVWRDAVSPHFQGELVIGRDLLEL
ncbi:MULTISPECIES: MBL fold metallo-hydrolase [unclassified Lysobacter]|uniref:MBL fold metallo-hydrolase n=1 Tax=unclassified Lysobacter TaxID=2635362 RepID=UPI0006F201F1|nr:MULTISPECIES: MBL fold metallo-hydrolase [unclassified Lysobacter]KQZ56321.1 MBL fold metallo-hydrolase [Lysobacter sp. Root559]KRC35241.1 MBL fold metallo-hydrolase [Lysobacter sp. Root76]KRD70931.1 MBL fold metallo-hydrolase [Lysobacter sp. Root96]